VIHPQTHAGHHLTILHGATIGAGTGGVPLIGDNVSIGCGATIIGGIRIGNHATIGAGAVVTKDIPAQALAVGVPARFLHSWQVE
jgi:serine acetyltransferase